MDIYTSHSDIQKQCSILFVNKYILPTMMQRESNFAKQSYFSHLWFILVSFRWIQLQLTKSSVNLKFLFHVRKVSSLNESTLLCSSQNGAERKSKSPCPIVREQDASDLCAVFVIIDFLWGQRYCLVLSRYNALYCPQISCVLVHQGPAIWGC